MMEHAIEHIEVRRQLIGMGVCPKCNVLYKVRAGDVPQDGVYRCSECGTEINLKKRPAR